MDKRLTRLASHTHLGPNRPTITVLQFNRWWTLQRGRTYRVDFNRDDPGQSNIVEVLLR